MRKINILSHSLANKIAAGEVVERPSSVVKELLENSIDAGSTNIKIIIKQFGIEEIRIIDNGSGISNDDIEIAFMRHATSKITTDYDLFHINTLGFRGEALASIASVSKIDIKSCAGEPQGKHLEILGGEIVLNEYYAPIKGTDITVKDLFYNTPARLKYLRNQNTEQGSIINIINKLALANPEISFEVIIDGKIALKTYGDGDKHKLISKIYTVSVAKNMLKFSGENDDYSIDGFISNPEETRANKNYINIFINGRYIKNFSIQNAIIDAYGTFLMKNRYPIAVINIKMDAILLDVNVHPTKQEVRLSKEAELITLIKEVISDRLKNNTYIPSGINNVVRKKTNNAEQISFTKNLDTTFTVNSTSYPETKKDFYKENLVENKYVFEKERDNFIEFITPVEDENILFGDELEKEITETRANIENTEPKIEEDNICSKDYKLNTITPNIEEDISEEDDKRAHYLPQLTVLAQIFKTYILAQTGDELYLIDQHAAQERCNYEKFQNSFEEFSKYKNQLLVPIVLNFSVEEYMKVTNSIEKIRQIGIELEEFGNNSYVAREYPSWIEENIEKTIEDIIETVVNNKDISYKELRDDAIAMASCKASIKANQYLSQIEMEKVIEDLYKCKNPFTCPHGRPIISKMTKKDLEKMFKRIV